MTIEEAIKIIDEWCDNGTHDFIHEALVMAKDALKAQSGKDINVRGKDTVYRQDAIDAVKHAWAKGLEPSQYIEALSSAEAERKTFRVIDTKTGKEADTYEIALHEEWAKGLIYCDMEGFAIEEDGTLILIGECGKYAYCPEGRFEVVWDE